MATNIVQMTDLHLYQDREGALAGLRTWDTFRAVLEQVQRDEGDCDYLVLTGDFAQDSALETYRMLREALGDWLPRCRLIPGNHDDPAHLRAAFPELFPPDDAPLTFEVTCGGWRLFGLDSYLAGEVKGRIDDAQLAWLKTRLAFDLATPALIFLHHPPVPINVAWIDALGLEAGRNFVELVERSAQVKVVCAGHVHQAFSGRIGDALMYTTPSTCVQFAPTNERELDTLTPGYRRFWLEEGGHRSEIRRLAVDWAAA